MAAVAAAAVTVAGGYASSQAQKRAADKAAKAQTGAAGAGIEEQQRQFDKIQELLQPYVGAGTNALEQQQAISGLLGPAAQEQAISGIEQSPFFGSLVRQGEEAILQNASATGGLRGGNVQGALAQFRPNVLQQLIESQYQKLGGISQQGQSAAAGLGAAGLQTGSNVTNLLTQQGQAQAGGAIAEGQAQTGFYGDISQAIGTGIGAYLNRPVNPAVNPGTPNQDPNALPAGGGASPMQF
jgi:hypothetical protein